MTDIMEAQLMDGAAEDMLMRFQFYLLAPRVALGQNKTDSHRTHCFILLFEVFWGQAAFNIVEKSS
jgi:hypothetical protein